MIDVIMVTFNRLQFTRQAINYLAERTTTPFNLLVIDNGSTDGTVEFVRGHPAVFAYWNNLENEGIHCALNKGLARVQSEFFITTDNDILCPLLEPDWLSQMIDLLERHKDFGAISMRPQVMVGAPGDMFDDCGEVKRTWHAGSSLRIMRTEVVHDVGGWRKVKKPGRDNEERWIADKLRRIGYKVGYARDLRCWHLFGDARNPWGYEGIPMEVHGHKPVWPPVHVWDTKEYRAKFDPETWRRK